MPTVCINTKISTCELIRNEQEKQNSNRIFYIKRNLENQNVAIKIDMECGIDNLLLIANIKFLLNSYEKKKRKTHKKELGRTIRTNKYKIYLY